MRKIVVGACRYSWLDRLPAYHLLNTLAAIPGQVAARWEERPGRAELLTGSRAPAAASAKIVLIEG
jgi:hypothetical protein